MPRAARDFSPIFPTEQVVLSFDFSPALAVGETLTSAQSVAVALVSGIDATPASRLIGGSAITGSFVTQMVGTLQPGAVYDFIATVTTSTGEILSTNAHQECFGIM